MILSPCHGIRRPSRIRFFIGCRGWDDILVHSMDPPNPLAQILEETLETRPDEEAFVDPDWPALRPTFRARDALAVLMRP